MDHHRLLDCLEIDQRRLRELGAGDPDTPVPSCPGWTVTDLLNHVARVYLHKVECMTLGHAPEVWPPEDLPDDAPLALFERASAELAQAFAAHDPADPTYTWYDPDQTVGFWIRRMAHETLIHRRDAELAFDVPTPAPDDLATDGIDELLSIFVGWATTKWANDIADELEARVGDTVLVDDWLLRPERDGIHVERGHADAAVRVSGSPSALVFWLWNRAAPSDGKVSVEGDPAVAERFRETLVLSTQ